MILDHTYHGGAWRMGENAREYITGAFRVIDRGEQFATIANGEDPETRWMIFNDDLTGQGMTREEQLEEAVKSLMRTCRSLHEDGPDTRKLNDAFATGRAAIQRPRATNPIAERIRKTHPEFFDPDNSFIARLERKR